MANRTDEVVRANIARAFRRWEEDLRSHPEQFPSFEESRAMDIEEMSLAQADQLIKYMKEPKK